MPSKLTFASIVFPNQTYEANSILFTESVREFGGSLSKSQIHMFYPEYDKQLSQKFIDHMSSLNVELIPFQMDLEVLRFPFTAHAYAAALAESKNLGKTEILAWMASNTVLLREPSEFLLPKTIALGYRPVHHTLLGLQYDEPLDPFWTKVYEFCNVPNENVFPMRPHVEDVSIRPYFNAGILITRPEKHLLKKWRDTYFKAYTNDAFQEFYKQDNRYAIFIHQAILSAVILAMYEKDELLELPHVYNYPVHLFNEDKTEGRPISIDECITFRHEGFYQDVDWMNKLPAKEALKKWLNEHLLKL
jgi:hypothetical protein